MVHRMEISTEIEICSATVFPHSEMGQTLSEPVTTKETSCCQNSTFRVGSSCMQGWRINMEDSHAHILSLPDDPDAAFFAVYDGHGGDMFADYASKHLHKFITDRGEYKEGNVAEAMRQAFLEIDEVMLGDKDLRIQQAGNLTLYGGNRTASSQDAMLPMDRIYA